MIKTRHRLMPLLDSAVYVSISFFHRVFAGTSPEPAGPLVPDRTVAAPVIGGNLDDPIRGQPLFSGRLKTYHPAFGDSLPQNTTVWMGYDEKALYFARRCEDIEPDKIKTSMSQRDRALTDDWVGVSLDAPGNHPASRIRVTL